MKATMRKNKMMLADVMVRFTVSAGHLVKAVQEDMADSPHTARRREYTRDRIESLLRVCLRENGEAMLMHSSSLEDDWETLAWAAVRKAFPEMCR